MSVFEIKCPKCGSVSTKNISNKGEKDTTMTCKNCQNTWMVTNKGSFF